MIESLLELYDSYKKKGINLHFFEGDIIDILKAIHKNHTINSIGFNHDYSPFSKKRDSLIVKWCRKNNIELFNEEDMLLTSISSKKSLNPNSQKPYLVYTPFYKNLINYDVDKLNKNKIKCKSDFINNKFLLNVNELSKYYNHNKDIHIKSGRKNGVIILKNISKFNSYDNKRNYLEFYSLFKFKF